MLMIMGKGYSQRSLLSNYDTNSNKAPFVFWKLTQISGEAFLKGQYRNQDIISSSFKDIQKSTVYTGGLLLTTKSYVWNPNFLIFDVTGEYNPEFNKDIYIVIPDKAEVRTLNRLDMRATFFSSKPITLSTFLNLNNLYQNRENLTNIKSNSKSWGGFYNFSNKVLPHNISFTKTQWNQQEIQTERNYFFDQTIFQANTSKTFTKYDDKHSLSYSHNEYISKLLSVNTISNYNEIKLNNDIYFDFKKNYHLLSMLTSDNQKGTNLNQKRLMAFENIFIKLPENLNLINSYYYNNTLYDTIRTIQNNITGSLNHKLYQSLYSSVFYEYNNWRSIYFKEIRTKAGFDLKYIKKIPLDGHLHLSYNYYKQINSTKADDVVLQVVREEHLLSDGQIVLLGKAYINISSVVVTDITGTIVYQNGLDYNLIDVNNYMEIFRIPGGLITNNSTVYVTYTANQPGTYKYNINYQMFNASIVLWKDLLEVYYRRIQQGYSNTNKTDYLALNYITQNIVGTKIQYDFIITGVEYDYYNSTIVPYKMLRYFVDLHQKFYDKVSVNINANLRDYKMLEDSSRNRFYDASGKITYNIKSSTNISAFGSYFKQDFNGTELNIIILGAELTSNIKKLYFSLGFDFYNRNNLSEKLKLSGVYIKITRKF